MHRQLWKILCLGAVLAGYPAASPSLAQTTQPASEDEALISLNFPENLELKLLVDYVAQRLNINILYDEQIASKRITLKTPVKIPKATLMGLLDSALKMKGLALVDAEQPGWKRIVATNDLLQIATRKIRGIDGKAGDAPGGVAVTQVFVLKHGDTKRAEQFIKPFLTQPGANTVPLPEQGLLIVTDFAANIGRISDLIKLMDQSRDNVVFEFAPVKNLEAQALAQQITQLLLSKEKALGTGVAGTEGLDVSADARTNQVVLIGMRNRVDEALKLVKSLDVALPVETHVYQFQTASADRVDRLAKELIGPVEAKRIYRSAIDREAGLLVVTTTPEIHEKLQALQGDFDKPISGKQSPVRFYKLENATATEVLNTIRSLETEEGFSAVSVEGLGGKPADHEPSGSQAQGPNQPPNPAGNVAPLPPLSTGDPRTGLVINPQNNKGDLLPLQSVRTRQATVTADANTNSIIVVAEPQVQEVYEQLIKTLDRRRPQVLVEITVVTIDTSKGFNIGVEISGRGTAGPVRFLNFSSFGLSDVNPNTGQLTLTPGIGFNGAVLTTDIADIVVQALKTNSRARVSSTPKILVNDNATGSLTSISESPFSSLNASDTVATTSFAGFVSAGTTIGVTPHISEGDHLQLEYTVALNNFTGESSVVGNAVLPPPRQTNSIESKVTIPDGNTIVVGGLTRKDFSKGKSAIPILGEIPIIDLLFSSQTENESESTLFVFIRPIILRDDQFKDLKFLSQRDAQKAKIKSDFPDSKPMVLR